VSVAVCSVILGGTAFAQSPPLVRVTSPAAAVTSRQHGKGDLRMTASQGTVLEVISTVGDRQVHRETNLYWVLIPRDLHGTRLVGWVSGRDVERVAGNVTTGSTALADRAVNRIAGASQEGRNAAALGGRAPQAVPGAATADAIGEPTNTGEPQLVSEVVLHFEFGKSALTDEAKAKLAEAVVALKGSAQSLSFTLEGHADSVGPEAYNERLGLARAEAVKRYLAEQHQIAVEKIGVVSYGEARPAASNDSREGRAQNRRVVVKVRS
jgi:outer membrane protein OmpA-like peptidoglycan-associated protein